MTRQRDVVLSERDEARHERDDLKTHNATLKDSLERAVAALKLAKTEMEVRSESQLLAQFWVLLQQKFGITFSLALSFVLVTAPQRHQSLARFVAGWSFNLLLCSSLDVSTVP